MNGSFKVVLTESQTRLCVFHLEAAALRHTKGEMETNGNILQRRCFFCIRITGCVMQGVISEIYSQRTESALILNIRGLRDFNTASARGAMYLDCSVGVFNKLELHYTNK